jgi:hypothetical protein
MAYIIAVIAGAFMGMAMGRPADPSNFGSEQLFSKRDVPCSPQNMADGVVSPQFRILLRSNHLT